MAKKLRKTSTKTAGDKKKSKARKTKTKALKTKSKAAAKKKTVAKSKKKSRPPAKRKTRSPTIGGHLANAYHTVIDTVKGTDDLRNKLEKPGTSETE